MAFTRDEPKSADDPDGLFAPVEEQDRAEGDFSDQATPVSYLTWLDTHPAAKWSLGAAVTLAAFSAIRAKS